MKDKLDLEKGNIAASLSRLEVSLSNAEATQLESRVTAERLTSIDVAQDLADYVKLKVLSNIQGALFAHAIENPQGLMDLLAA